jgi:adenylate kinase
LGTKLSVAPVSTGDIFREEIKRDTDLGKRVSGYLSRGELVPDSVVIDVLEDRISRPDAEKGFILDGFPRTVAQAEALQKIVKIDAVIRLIVPEWIIIERLSNRRICKKCGAIYNVKYLKPKKPGICDKCGGALYQREDDKTEVIKERLKIYEKQTQPLIAYYQDKVPFINAECNKLDMPPETVVDEILKKLQKHI